jgi:hypothetical protein
MELVGHACRLGVSAIDRLPLTLTPPTNEPAAAG